MKVIFFFRAKSPKTVSSEKSDEVEESAHSIAVYREVSPVRVIDETVLSYRMRHKAKMDRLHFPRFRYKRYRNRQNEVVASGDSISSEENRHRSRESSSWTLLEISISSLA
jgi:hypothetical protein